MAAEVAAKWHPIEFKLGDRALRVEQCAPTTTLLDFLREQAHDCSVKEGCAEGDCGACTVAVSERNANGAVQTRAVNACIQFLPTLHGKQVHTARTITGPEGLNPVQQAMVDCHASQCGFCTPGFVMSLWAWREQALTDLASGKAVAPLDRAAAQRVLSGNLCRCTGYRPILDAACSLPLVASATEVRADPPLASTSSSQAPMLAQPPGATQPMAPAETDSMAPATTDSADQLVFGGVGPDRFFAPRTLKALAQLRLDHPQATLLAGGTDIGLWVTKQHRALGDVIWLGEVRELQTLEQQDQQVRVGAAVLLERAWDLLAERIPNIRHYLDRFASVPIRQAGTAVGNLANGSPIGDLPPLMLALDAQLVLRQGEHTRRLPLRDFYLGYQKKALQPGEFVEAVLFDWPSVAAQVHAEKLSKRIEQDISAVALCTHWTVDPVGRLAQVRLGVGGMAAIPSRAPQTERLLEGARLDDPQTWQAALEQISNEFSPISDMRATAEYRRAAIRGLLLRCLQSVRLQEVA